MATVKVHCPVCESNQVIKHGVSDEGKQRYQCKNIDCSKNTFLLDYSYAACSPGVKEKIVEMTLNGSGVRDTSRVLEVSINTVIDNLAKVYERLKRKNHHTLIQQ
jgi:transposase-like protein